MSDDCPRAPLSQLTPDRQRQSNAVRRSVPSFVRTQDETLVPGIARPIKKITEILF